MQDLYKQVMHKDRPQAYFFIFSFSLVLILSFSVSARQYTIDYNNPLTRSIADNLYCLRGGDCVLNNLILNGNLSFIGSVLNITIINQDVIGQLTVEGNTTIQNTNGDIELKLRSQINKHSYLYFLESDNLGFRLWYDGSGDNVFKFDALDGLGDIVPQMWFDRSTLDIDFFAPVDMNDNNLSNVQCLELDNSQICSWSDVNASIYWNLSGTGNITPKSGRSVISPQYYGLFNWYITPDVSTSYLQFNKSYLTFNESKLNETIEAKIASKEYNASNITVEAGTYTGGTLFSIQVAGDGDWYNVTEAGGVPPVLDIIINFTNIPNFNSVQFDVRYDDGGGHQMAIGVWHCGDSAYEEEYQPNLEDTSGLMARQARTVLDPASHICGVNNTVSVRFRHINTGAPSHEWFMDDIKLVQGAAISSPVEVDPFAIHFDGDVPWQGNENGNGYNTTGWNIGIFNQIKSDNGTIEVKSNLNGTGYNASFDNFFGNCIGNVSGENISDTYIPYTGSIKAVALGTFDFSVSGSDFYVDTSVNDKIGMGTSSPAANLHIQIDAGASVLPLMSGTDMILEDLSDDADGARFSLMGGNASGDSTINFGDRNNEDSGQIRYNHGSDSFNISTNSVTNRLIIDSLGRVGIGTSPTSLLHVNGNITSSEKICDSTGCIGTPTNTTEFIKNDTTARLNLTNKAGTVKFYIEDGAFIIE